MNNFLIVLLGPTGVGKTDISIELAEHFKCEIISADSRQLFKEMSIGTAVPTDDQLIAVKHHFVRVLSVESYYSASLFERDVLNLLPVLFVKNNIVLMSGGSGMYIDAVCNGIDDIPDVDVTLRQKYITLYKTEGIEGLRIALKLLDPDHYAKVDLKNHKRLMRALEICETTGRTYTSYLKKQNTERDFRVIKVGLGRPRNDLYMRINARVDEMIENGLVEEVRNLYQFRNNNALNSVGYREIVDFLDGKYTLERAVELIKRNSRRYAKRQITWWNKDKEIRWFMPEQVEEIISYIKLSVTARSSPGKG